MIARVGSTMPGSQPQGWILGTMLNEKRRDQPRIKSRQLFFLTSTQQYCAAFLMLAEATGYGFTRSRVPTV